MSVGVGLSSPAVPPARVEQSARQFLIHLALAFDARFVHLLDCLKRQDDVSHFVGLAVPNETPHLENLCSRVALLVDTLAAARRVPFVK